MSRWRNDDRDDAGLATHEYGRPTEVLQLDTVPVPEPDAGELRVRVQAIPFNLNDLERITGGNMMVRPELPYSPGMEVMGVVDACGAGAEAWQGKRVVAMPEGRARRLRRVRDLSGGLDVRHARRRSRSPTRPRCTSPSISRGSASTTAPTCRPARAC